MPLPLTDMYTSETEDGFRKTPDGMAYWSGTGPRGRQCHECRHYTDEGTYASGKNAGGKKPGRCLQFSAMMQGKKGPKISPHTAGCRYFSEKNTTGGRGG